jgi:hypothetical protein
MNATTYPDGGEGLGYDDEFGERLPPRPRRRLLTPWTALLFAILLGAAGFYVGVRVEKNHASSSGAGAGLAGRLSAGGTSAKGGFAARFARGTSATSGAGGGFAGGGFPGGGGTAGTIASVNGKTIYLTETSGNTVKVKLNSATTVKKTQTVSKQKLYPGDSLMVTGATGKNGVITATAVTDSGASGSSSSSSSGTSSSGTSGSSGSSSVVSQLFGNG